MSSNATKNGQHLRAIDLARTLVSQMPEATNAQLVPKMESHGFAESTSVLRLGEARREARERQQTLKDRGLDLREERSQEDLFVSLEKVAEELEAAETKKPQEDVVNVAALISVKELTDRLGHEAVVRAVEVLEKLGGVK